MTKIKSHQGYENNRQRLNKLFLIFFIIVALASGWIGVGVDQLLGNQSQTESLGMLVWLVLPFLCGLIIRYIRRDWHDVGIKPKLSGNLSWYALAIGVFPVVMIVYVTIASMFGMVKFTFTDDISIIPVLGSMLMGLLIKNIFEDFAWQGFLTPKLVELRYNDFIIYGVVGLVWAFWHAPYYLFFLPDSMYSAPMHRILDTFVYSPIVITLWAIMFVELTRITQSVWPALLMHTIEDLIPNFVFFEARLIEFQGLGDVLFNPLRGVFPLLTFVCIGLWIRQQRLKKEALNDDFALSL